jgi:hypothetical protein
MLKDDKLREAHRKIDEVLGYLPIGSLSAYINPDLGEKLENALLSLSRIRQELGVHPIKLSTKDKSIQSTLDVQIRRINGLHEADVSKRAMNVFKERWAFA